MNAAPSVGLFGLLGSGNSGNDASMETVLAYLREARPDIVVDALCGGPERVRANYGIDAAPLYWYSRFEGRATGVPAAFLKVAGKGIDALRIASWVRRHDAVIVAGAGALETTLPQRPWGYHTRCSYSPPPDASSARKWHSSAWERTSSTSERPGGCRTQPHGSPPTALIGTRTRGMQCISAASTPP